MSSVTTSPTISSVDALTFGLGSGIAGLAGVALSQIDNVSPNLGQSYIIDSFLVVVFGGVDGAGKGESANLVSQWLDPRRVITSAFSEPTDEEAERPPFWRYWRALPPKGFVGVFLSAWYSKPFLARAKGEITIERYEEELRRHNQAILEREEAALTERRQAALPPFSCLALLRAEIRQLRLPSKR